MRPWWIVGVKNVNIKDWCACERIYGGDGVSKTTTGEPGEKRRGERRGEEINEEALH